MDCMTKPAWAPTAERLNEAVNRLVAAAQPLKVILFGSHARGEADDHSDVDLLIIEPTVSNRYEEMIRLNRALRGMLMSVDLLVVSEKEFEQRSATPGTVEHTARREGRLRYAA
jgi:predicted nucleotidyltransferase